MTYEVTKQELRLKDWILDSDANAHYYNDISLFVKYAEYHNQNHNQGTHIADRLAPDLSIQDISKVKLEINKLDGESNEFFIFDIYYAPTVRINIISSNIYSINRESIVYGLN